MSARSSGRHIPYPTSLDELSDLDVQIVALLRRGLNYTEIGRHTGIHNRTIAHRATAIRQIHLQHGITLPDPRQDGRTPIARTVDDVGPMDQQVIELFRQGLQYMEISRRLCMPRQTVATRIARLRDYLGEHIIPRRHAKPAGEHRNPAEQSRPPAAESRSTAEQSRPGDRAGRVRCLGGCDQHFNSPDRCRIRICARCKAKQRENSDGYTEHRLFTA